ncbi:unnamed protein product [Ilex paraguariensis]|uniref:Uncharacterized protein n=1 Tax=Ilex paraguariensis TaxID=185542 RepID=A0ABC8T4P1_9AQUA
MSWVVEVDHDLEKMGDASTGMEPLKKKSIYRVPSFIANLNKGVYSPHAVSFGPYHHGEAHLEPMECHKKRSLLHFLKNRASFPLKLKDILDSFAQVEEELKDSYDSLDPKWHSDKEGFLKLMIIDGCFMLEIFRAAIKTPDDYHSDDPIFSKHGKLNIMPFIKRDMLMLENQLPMLVLDKLLAISMNGDESINELIHQFCNPDSRDIPPPTEKYLHVLDMFRKSLFMKSSATPSMTCMGIGTVTGTDMDTGTVTGIGAATATRTDTSTDIGTETGTEIVIGTGTGTNAATATGTGTSTGTGEGTKTGTSAGSDASKKDRCTWKGKGKQSDELIPITRSATELNEAGVRFKRIKKSPSIKDISFEGGVLSLPTFVIDDTTKSTFLNMIAFEHCHVGAGHEVASYIWFMDNLIDTSSDVRFLQGKRIVQNLIGSDKGAADLFNTISNDLTIDPESQLGWVNSAMSWYCERRRNRWRANLIHTYFTNPWTLISVVAAGVLFGLTIAQTAYGALQYYQG